MILGQPLYLRLRCQGESGTVCRQKFVHLTGSWCFFEEHRIPAGLSLGGSFSQRKILLPPVRYTWDCMMESRRQSSSCCFRSVFVSPSAYSNVPLSCSYLDLSDSTYLTSDPLILPWTGVLEKTLGGVCSPIDVCDPSMDGLSTSSFQNLYKKHISARGRWRQWTLGYGHWCFGGRLNVVTYLINMFAMYP